MSGDIRNGILHTIGKATKPILLPLFWFSLGGAFVAYQQPVKRLDNVLVIERRPDGSVQTIADGTGRFETTTCAPNDFQPGEKFVYWLYVNQYNCKSFRGIGRGFKAYTDADGNRIKFPIQQEIADVR